MDHSRLKGSTVPPWELQHEASSKLEHLDSCVRRPVTWYREVKKKKSFFSFLWPCYITHGILIPQPETKSLWKYGILTTGPLQKSPRALSSDPWVWIQAQSFTITGCQGKSQCSDLLRGHHCVPLIEYSVRSKWKTLTEQPGCGLVERTQAPGKWCILASLWLAYYYLLQDDYWLSALSSSHSLNTC